MAESGGTDPLQNDEFHHPQVRELEKQLAQTRSPSAGTSRDDLSVCPDPRKLSAQERNLLRIRSLERERQDGWEVTHVQGGGQLGTWHRETATTLRPMWSRDLSHPLEAGDTWGLGSPQCLFLTSCPSSWNCLTGSLAHFMSLGWPHPGCSGG